MKGNENLAYEKDLSVKEGPIQNEMELRIEGVSDEPDAENEEVSSSKNDAKGSNFVVVVRHRMHTCINKYQKGFKIALHTLLQALLIGYLIAAVYVYTKKGHSVDFWNGLGLLLLIYGFVYLGLFYYLVLKPRLGPPLRRYVLEPVKTSTKGFRKGRKLPILIYGALAVALVIYLAVDTTENRQRLMSFFGIVVFILFGFIFSKHPAQINWRPVLTGLAMQFIFGIIIIRWSVGRNILMYCGEKVDSFLSFTKNGTLFVYGALVEEKFEESFGAIFAFTALPVIFFFSFFVSILSYFGALQWSVIKLGWMIQVVMGTTVCESVNAAASIFLGMTESILLFRNNIKDLTKSELHAVMCEGWATVAGTVLAAFISFGINAGHLIGASLMSAPAALSFSKLFYPETERSKNTISTIDLHQEEGTNVLDAACKGAMRAIEIVAGIIANLIAFLAFIAFLDSVLNWLGVLVDFRKLSMKYVLTKVFIPVSFLMGVDSESVEDVAFLVGTKTVINEFQAYKLMSEIKHKFSPRTEAIATYALCGFSNFASIGIFIGGLSSIEPSQISNATEVALRAFISANIVCFLTASVAGTLLEI